jgi:hypothetical protein
MTSAFGFCTALVAFLATYHLLIHLRKSRATRPDSWIRRFLAMEAPAIFIHRLLRLRSVEQRAGLSPGPTLPLNRINAKITRSRVVRGMVSARRTTS